MKLSKRIDIVKIITYTMMATSSMIIIQVQGKTVFFLLQILFIATMFLISKRVPIVDSMLVNLIMIEIIIGAVVSITTGNPESYKKTAIYMSCMLVVLYFASSYLIYAIRKKYISLNGIKKSLKIMSTIQLIWVIVQYVLYNSIQFDLNKVLFVETLGMVNNASAFKLAGVIMPSGLSWHPSLLAPLIVISFYLYDSCYMKLLAVLVAFICGNSTALIGAVLCIAFELVNVSIKISKHKKIKVWITLAIIIIGVIGSFVVYRFGIIEIVIEKMVHIYERIFGHIYDGGSALAHKRYFTAYFDVINISSIPQILFGYGEGCSGYPYDQLFNQYGYLSSWAVECDIMNIMVSRGIIGFILYYSMICWIAIKGWFINHKYTIIMVILVIQGITYNIQFDWVIMLNILLIYFVDKGYDIFQNNAGDKSSLKDATKMHMKVYTVDNKK